MAEHKNPYPTVDIIIEMTRDDGRTGFVLIQRKNPPLGWALPGGFVDYGESLEMAAVREAKEETSLDIELIGQFHTYSDPGRDPRSHTISTVFIAGAVGRPRAQDDAQDIGVFTAEDMPHPLAFDHEEILADYFRRRRPENFDGPAKPAYDNLPLEDKNRLKKDRNVKLKELRRVMGPVEAEVIRSLLLSHGITCILGGTMVQSIYPSSVDGMGEVRILVAGTDYAIARELLENNPLPESD
jgi:ADP-ribose pyrophosphatase YjhB (NUDIX family)